VHNSSSIDILLRRRIASEEARHEYGIRA